MARTALLGGVALLFSACQATENPEPKGMARFAADPVFCASHDLPEPMTYTAQGTPVSFPTPDGKTGRGYRSDPVSGEDAVLLVFHEWWGLNDHIRRETDRLADSLDITVLALDLYDGKVAATRDEASNLMQNARPDRLKAIIQGAIRLIGPKPRIGTIGWCFGGSWSLQASILAANQGAACVMYYGMPVEQEDELAPLAAPVLGLFASRDGWITREVVLNFAEKCHVMGKDFRYYFFDAEHAFANPTSPRFNEPAAREAQAKALTFLREHLRLPGR